MTFPRLFFSMCFAGVVFCGSCLNSRTPRTPLIRLRRCRVVQNQGLVNLGKVWKSHTPDTHFDVISETFDSQSLICLCFMGCLVSVRLFNKSGIREGRRGRSPGRPRNYNFKRFSISVEEYRARILNGYGPEGRRIYK